MTKNLLAILFILAALGTAIYWTRPLFEEVQTLIAKREELNTTLLRFQELKKVRDELLNKYNSISREDLKRLEELLPRSPEVGLLLVNLENVSRTQGVSLNGLRVEEIIGSSANSKNENSLQSLPVEISVSSSYEVFRSFLSALELSRRIIDIESVSFAAGDENNYNFAIKGVTYWQSR
jgi:Tfp pilus assembly protein PilO